MTGIITRGVSEGLEAFSAYHNSEAMKAVLPGEEGRGTVKEESKISMVASIAADTFEMLAGVKENGIGAGLGWIVSGVRGGLYKPNPTFLTKIKSAAGTVFGISLIAGEISDNPRTLKIKDLLQSSTNAAVLAKLSLGGTERNTKLLYGLVAAYYLVDTCNNFLELMKEAGLITDGNDDSLSSTTGSSFSNSSYGYSSYGNSSYGYGNNRE